MWSVAAWAQTARPAAATPSPQGTLGDAGLRVAEALAVAQAVADAQPIALAPDRRVAWEMWLMRQAVEGLVANGHIDTRPGVERWLGPLREAPSFAPFARLAAREARPTSAPHVVSTDALMGRRAPAQPERYPPFDGAAAVVACARRDASEAASSELARPAGVVGEGLAAPAPRVAPSDAGSGGQQLSSSASPSPTSPYRVFDARPLAKPAARAGEGATTYAPFDGLPAFSTAKTSPPEVSAVADEGGRDCRTGWRELAREEASRCLLPDGYWPFDAPVRCVLSTSAELDVAPLFHPVTHEVRDVALLLRGAHRTLVSPVPVLVTHAQADQAQLIELRAVASVVRPFASAWSVERVVLGFFAADYAHRSHAAWLMARVCHAEQPCRAYRLPLGQDGEALVLVHALPGSEPPNLPVAAWLYSMEQALGRAR